MDEPTNQQNSSRKIFLEKIFCHKKNHALYISWRFITVFTKAHHWTLS